MADQLGHALPELRVQHPEEPGDADPLQMGFAVPSAVELREAAHSGGTAHRHSDALGPRSHVPQESRAAMHVVVGVHVRRRRADELHKARELTLKVGGNALWVVPVELEMQPQAERWAFAAQADRLLARRAVHEQARAREDPLAMGFDDSAVDAAADPEVVCGDDEELHGRLHSGSGGRSAANHRSNSMTSSIPHSAPSRRSARAAQRMQWQ